MEGDTINGFKWNLACECKPSVDCLLPNLARISKRDGLKSPTKCENLVEIAMFWRFFALHGDTIH